MNTLDEFNITSIGYRDLAGAGTNEINTICSATLPDGTISLVTSYFNACEDASPSNERYGFIQSLVQRSGSNVSIIGTVTSSIAGSMDWQFIMSSSSSTLLTSLSSSDAKIKNVNVTMHVEPAFTMFDPMILSPLAYYKAVPKNLAFDATGKVTTLLNSVSTSYMLTQSNATLRPSYSPRATWHTSNAQSHYLQSGPIPLASGDPVYTIAFVAEFTSLPAAGEFPHIIQIGASTLSGVRIYLAPGNTWVIYHDGVEYAAFSATPPTGSCFSGVAYYDGTNIAMTMNNVVIRTPTPLGNLTEPTVCTTFGSDNTGAYIFYGKIYEAAVYDRCLTADERRRLSAYYTSMYGVA